MLLKKLALSPCDIAKMARRCHCGDGCQIVSKARYKFDASALNVLVFHKASVGPSLQWSPYYHGLTHYATQEELHVLPI